jgi:hypothetical protein
MTDESRPLEPWVGTANGREANGLFAKGNRLATGNPQAKRAAELRKVLRDATTEDDVKDVWKSLTAAAVGGDVIAIRLFLEHTVGKPVTPVEVTGAGEAPIQTDITAIVAIIQQEEPDPDRRLKIARRILSLGQQTVEVASDGPGNANSPTA